MKLKFLLKVLFFSLLLIETSYAYIDPGSGSAIISAIIGFFVAIGVVLKTFWYKILQILSLKKSPKDENKISENDK